MFTKFQKEKENDKTKKAPNGNFFFVNPKAVLLHQWMDLVVSMNLPLSAVENPSLRNIASLVNDCSVQHGKSTQASQFNNLK